MLKKILLLNKPKGRCVTRKEISVFDVMKNNQIFSSKVCHLLYDHRLFLVEKWGALEVEKKYEWKNLLNLGCQDSNRFGIFQVG